MTKEVRDYVAEKTRELIAAPSCSPEAKAAALAWLDAAGTDKETEQTKSYVAELEADIVPIDGLIAFAESENGARIFGGQAEKIAAHAKEVKAAGGKYCDCPACAAVEAILRKKAEILA